MKYSARQNQNLSNAQIANANKWNLPLLDGVRNKFGFMSEELERQVRAINKKVVRIVCMTYEDFDDRFNGVAILRDKTVIKMVDGEDRKTGMPILYAYVPEYDKLIQEWHMEHLRKKNLERLNTLFQKQNGHEDKRLKEFILTKLPAEIPFQTYFDGSRVRVSKLAELDGATLYGDTSDDVFAVIYNHRDSTVITIFVYGLDYVRSFANQLVKQLDITFEAALKISGAMNHNRYYSIQTPVFTDFERYVTEMARLLKVEEGATAHDLLQGDVEVVTGVFSQKLALDLDDELPSAVLVGGRVNVFLPEKK